MSDRNIFVIGLNDFNLAKLRRIHGADDYAFHGLLDPAEILEADSFPIDDMLDRAERQLADFRGKPDAVVGYMDFPVSTMLPLLAARAGLRSASLTALLKCEHKYWSRLEQRRVVPEHIPRFAAFDPFGADPLGEIGLDFPFWIKPIKSAGSYLGFRINDEAELDAALAIVREQIGRFGDPFNHILARADLPDEIASVDGNHCLAEEIIGGWQCTLEGYVQNGEPRVYGVVDSVRERASSSFQRYQYPSRLPRRITRRMTEITAAFLKQIGFDDSAFNAELFWDRRRDRIWLLEVNTRIAQHHSDLFEKVDGISNHEIMVDAALGKRPRMPHREGPYRCAAALFLRHHRDAEVTRVPTDAEIAALERRFPGIVVEPHVHPGQVLSQLPDQDSYSFVLAIVYLGARDQKELLARWREVVATLDFGLRERAERPPALAL